MHPLPESAPLTLIVDHRKARRTKLHDLLDGQGILAVEVGSLPEARTALLADPEIRVVLLELGVSAEEGESPLDVIRAGNPDVAVVVLAKDAQEDGAMEAVRAGAEDYLLHGQVQETVLPRVLTCAVASRRAVSERTRAEGALETCEQRYRSLFDVCQEGICTVDDHGLVTEANRAAVELLGDSHEKLTGRLLETLFVRTEDREAVREAIAERKTIERVEAPVRRADGSPHWVSLSVAPCEGESGYHVLLQDFTSRSSTGVASPSAAFYDPLTRIPNRSLLLDRLNWVVNRRDRGEGRSFAVMFVDLDGFKDVNDSFGHDVGDELLQQVAARLSDSIREEDTVARLGGDEFVVLLSQIDDGEEATIIADRILHHIGRGFHLADREVRLTCSVGITVGTHESASPEEILRQADYAMYQAKGLGPGKYQIYDRVMQARVLRTLRLDAELRRALARDEFVLHYQPVVRADSGRLHGFEALVRWRHPERGLVSPSDFIPVAEQRGFIEAIGSWVLDEVCRQLREWRDRYPESDLISISVNLSAAEFLRPDFVDDVQRAIREHQVPPELIRLELTESTLAADPAVTASAFRRLRNLGIRVSIDDFGHGFSSWSYLDRTPVDSLKIPRPERVGNGNGGSSGKPAIKRIAQLARCLGMNAVAEGVETEEELQEHRAAGSSLAQGYLFWKPLDAAEAGALLETGSPRGGTPVSPSGG